MKNNDIESIIKRDLSLSMPNVLSKIDLQSIEINQPKRKKFNAIFRTPKFAYAGVIAVMVLAFILIFQLGKETDLPVDNTGVAFNEKEEVYAITALSAVSLLHQNIENPTNQLYNNFGHILLSANYVKDTNRLVDQHIETLNKYLNAIEPVINNRSQLVFEVEASDLDGYEYKLKFHSFDLLNQPIQKEIYFNELVSGDKRLLEGIMIIEDLTYVMEAQINLEGDAFELEMEAYRLGNEEHSIYVYQEIKAGSQTFEYEFIRFGETIFESSIKIINKDNAIVIELEYETLTQEVKFEIKRVSHEMHDVLAIEFEIESEFFDEEGSMVLEVLFDPDIERFVFHYTITIDNESYTYNKSREIDNQITFNVENQLEIIHLYTHQIINYFELRKTNLFTEVDSAFEAFDYTRHFPVIIDNQIDYLIFKYRLIPDGDDHQFNGVMVFNEQVYIAEGTLEVDGETSALNVLFYDPNDEDNYIELKEAFDENYVLMYTLYIADKEVFSLEILIENNEVEILIEMDEISLEQELFFVDTQNIILTGSYELSSITDEEGIIQIMFVHEKRYYRYAITVNNITKHFDIVSE